MQAPEVVHPLAAELERASAWLDQHPELLDTIGRCVAGSTTFGREGTWRGLTLDDIQRDFEVARRTAERLRNAVEDVFGPLELVDTGERRHHWRLRTSTLRSLVTVSAEELAELNAAAAALDRTGLVERAAMLRQLADKLRALLEQDALTQIEPDLQALMVAEGLAMRPGPRPRLDPGLLGLLRDAIKTGRVVAFDYRARAT